MSIRDLSDQVFDRLTVIKRDITVKSRKAYWVCKCRCGNKKTIRSDSLVRGLVKSCGCLKREQDRINLEKNHSHKFSGTSLYWMWQHMKNRCYKPQAKAYQYYGARGITVCEEWKNDSNAFIKWALANGYEENLSIDRIDVNGNYEPSNCRFLDFKGQCNNRRSNIFFEYQGQKLTLMQIAEKTGMNYGTISSRLKRNPHFTLKDILKPVGYYKENSRRLGSKNNKATTNEETVTEIKKLLMLKKMTQVEIAEKCGVTTSVVNSIRAGITWKHVTI